MNINDKDARVKYIRALERFLGSCVSALKNENFDFALFVKRAEKGLKTKPQPGHPGSVSVHEKPRATSPDLRDCSPIKSRLSNRLKQMKPASAALLTKPQFFRAAAADERYLNLNA